MKRSLRKMLTVIVTITMVFAVAVPVTAYYEQYSDCTFEYADYDFEYENGYVGLDIAYIILADGLTDDNVVDEPILQEEPMPPWVWQHQPALMIPEKQDFIEITTTLTAHQYFVAAGIGFVFPAGSLRMPTADMMSPRVSMAPNPAGMTTSLFFQNAAVIPTGMTAPVDAWNHTWAGLLPFGVFTDTITITFRMYIEPGFLVNTGDTLTVALRRPNMMDIPMEDAVVTIIRGGMVDLVYTSGIATTPIKNMPASPQSVAFGSTVIVPATSPSATGYDFAGWLVSGGPTGWTLPGIDGVVQPGATFVMPAAAVTLTAQWTQAQSQPGTGDPGTETITVTFDLQGGTATFPLTQNVVSGARISAPMPEPTRENFKFAGWYTAEVGGTQFDFATPITVNTIIFARWHSVLIKLPDRQTTQVGDKINWTLKGFHNPMDFGVTNFAIVDTPGLGLNFQSGRLPAFTNGSGITYDIFYSIYGDDTWRTHNVGIDASRSFYFNFPQDGSTFYSGIKFCFGDVPVGFGLGNEIVLTFIVGYGAPNNQLVNRFFLLYNEKEIEGKNPDKPTVLYPGRDSGSSAYEASEDGSYYATRDYEYLEIGDISVPLGGFESYRRSNVPQTGAGENSIGIVLLSLLSLAILKKRKTTDKIATEN